jgi:hypothetical protein
VRIIVCSIFISLLSACGSTSENSQIAIPGAEPRKGVFETNEKAKRKYNIIYQTDARGNPIYQQTWTQVTVVGGEKDSLASLTGFAKEKAKQQAIEEINGVLIEDKTKINSISVKSENNQYSYQDMHSEYVSEALGIGKIKEQKCKSSLTVDNTIKLTCSILVEVPKIKKVEAL